MRETSLSIHDNASKYLTSAISVNFACRLASFVLILLIHLIKSACPNADLIQMVLYIYRQSLNIERPHRRLHIVVHNVGVDHRRGETRMAEGFLHEPDVLSLAVEFGGVGVAEHVRVYAFLNARFPSPPTEHFAQGLSVDASAMECGKTVDGLGCTFTPGAHELERGLIHPHLAILVPLTTAHHEPAGMQINIVPGEIEHFARAQPGVEHELDHAQVARSGRVVTIGGGEKRPGFVAREHLG